MKKVFMFMAAVMVAFCAVAQDDDLDFKDVNPDNYLNPKHLEKIEKVMKQKEANTGEADVDAFINSSILGAQGAVASNIKLREMYKREIGETDADGVTDVTVSKPTAQDWIDLGTAVAAQAQAATTAGMKVKELTTKAKDLGGMKGVKAAKEVAGSGNNWAVIGEELANQVKAIKAIQDVKKSKDNH